MVTIRMYDVGFGDCFLLRFRSGQDEQRVLIDCGTHPAGRGRRPFPEVVRGLQADLAALPQPHLHAVVATHRHRDHVWGFEQPGWDQITASEVWLPWTEDPADSTARALLERMSKAAIAFSELATLNTNTAIQDLLENSLKNDNAIKTLREGLGGRPLIRYLGLRSDDLDGLAGVETDLDFPVHLLGPWRDEETIRDQEPPERQSYVAVPGRELRLMTTDTPPPLDRWRTSFDTYRLEHPNLVSLMGNIGAFINAARFPAYDLAVSIEQAVNGTSLMLMFEFGSAYLLFPGDAQWGTWRRALSNPAARQLLGRTTFLKVGHHGSHNATPKEFVDEVLDRPTAAMVSVAPTGIDNWSDIPKTRLLNALREHTQLLIRSDQPTRLDRVRFGPGDAWCEIDIDA